MDRAKTPSKAAFGSDERGFADGFFALVSSHRRRRLLGISKKRNHSLLIEESTYNRNRKRDLNDGVETNHERAGGAFDRRFSLFRRAGKTSFVFFPAADSSRAGRVFARGLGFRAASFSSLCFRHFSSRFFFRLRSRRLSSRDPTGQKRCGRRTTAMVR